MTFRPSWRKPICSSNRFKELLVFTPGGLSRFGAAARFAWVGFARQSVLHGGSDSCFAACGGTGNRARLRTRNALLLLAWAFGLFGASVFPCRTTLLANA